MTQGSGFEHAVGMLGLSLMLMVARLSDTAYAPHLTIAARLSGLLARRGIDAIALVGRAADHLPAPRR